MKYLRNFPNAIARDEALANIDYAVLSYTEDVGIYVKPEESGSDIPANDEIWYTTNTGTALPNGCISSNVIYQTKEDLLNFVNPLTLISNTYSNGKGILKFDRSVGALSSCIMRNYDPDEQYVTSVILPESFVYAFPDAFLNVSSAQIVSYGTMQGYDWKVPPM